MKLKTFVVATVALSFVLGSCSQKENKNLVVESSQRDVRVDNFFNAVGIPLNPMSANNVEGITEELSSISTLFTNAMPPKKNFTVNGELEEGQPPFYMLAENAGLMIASQIWKTQLTSVDDVRFLDLATVDMNDDASQIKFKSENFNLPAVFLNPYGNKQDPENYLGSVLNGQYGKYTSANFAPESFIPLSHLYIMEYKLRDEKGSRNGNGVRTYYALVSIPTNVRQQTRLIMYAHGGDYGIASYELITFFNMKLKDFVVVAPLFPGEPLCTQMSLQNNGCMRFTQQGALVKDDVGTYNNPNVQTPFNSIVPLAYPRSPLLEDINAFLGAHNAVSRIMNLAVLKNSANPLYSETLPQNSLLMPLEHPDSLVNAFQELDNNGAPLVPTLLAPQSIMVASSRGGGVALASLGRLGFLMNGASANTPFAHTVKDEDGSTFEFQYPLFNGASLFFSPSSMLTGKLRLFTMMIIENKLDAIRSLPMATDLAQNPFFVNYRADKGYLSEIQPPKKDESGHSVGPADDSLSQLITYVALNDITFLAPFVSTALQNWNSFRFDTEPNVRAPGSLILLHGSQDLVVPMTESTIATQALSTVWAGLYNTPVDPFGGYLSTPQFSLLHPILKGSFIPGVGVAQYSFQPTAHFFNVPCEKASLAAIQQPDIIYNADVKRCFGGGYSPTADGTNAVGKFYGHSDPSFFTSRLINTIEDKNIYMSVLSSNIVNNAPTNHHTFEYDSKHINMKYGGPTNTGFDDCAPGVDCSFPYYSIPLASPTFMRYMTAEGVPSSSPVAEKKSIFAGEFKKNNKSNLKPQDVFFAWLTSVACDECTPAAGEPSFPEHLGVFHDFSK